MFPSGDVFARRAERDLETLQTYRERLDKLDLGNEEDVKTLKDMSDRFKYFTASSAPLEVLATMDLVDRKFEVRLAECRKNHSDIYQKVFQPAAQALQEQKPKVGFFKRLFG
jgi:hypothetical protein